MIYNPDTNKLRTTRKAPYRKIEINPDVLLHIMFWKAERYFGYRTKAEILEDYKAKKDLKALGTEISHKIRALENKLANSDKTFYEERYRELQQEWKERFGTSYIDFDKIPTNNGLNRYDIQYLENAANAINKLIEKFKNEGEKNG